VRGVAVSTEPGKEVASRGSTDPLISESDSCFALCGEGGLVSLVLESGTSVADACDRSSVEHRRTRRRVADDVKRN
jgi:hypothetical protein